MDELLILYIFPIKVPCIERPRQSQSYVAEQSCTLLHLIRALKTNCTHSKLAQELERMSKPQKQQGQILLWGNQHTICNHLKLHIDSGAKLFLCEGKAVHFHMLNVCISNIKNQELILLISTQQPFRY